MLRGSGIPLRIIIAASLLCVLLYFGWANYDSLPRPHAVPAKPEIPNAQPQGSFRDPTNSGADEKKTQQYNSAPKKGETKPKYETETSVTPQIGGDSDKGVTYSNQEKSSPLPLPKDYTPEPWKDQWCVDAYGLEHLYDFRERNHAYCEERGSRSPTQCFTNTLAPDYPQSFCVTQNMLLRPVAESSPWEKDAKELMRFGMECELKQWGKDAEGTTIGPEGKHTDLFGMPKHMFETGIGIMMQRYVELFNRTHPLPPSYEESMKTCSTQARQKGYKILVKRDGSKGSHPWHSMMEIIAFHWNIDVLRMTRNPSDPSQPYFTDSDIEHSQIIILDDEPLGPFFDLWRLYAKKEPVRWTDLDSTTPLCLDRVIMPMPGASNPMWSGDWKVRNCRNSPTMDTFIQRGLDHFAVKDRRPANAPITVTFVERHNFRQLKDWDAKVAIVRSQFPDGSKVKIQSIDLGALPSFADQLQILQETDVLIGAHGAGLSMAMWMPQGGAVVEILPDDFWHKGFRNMAKLMGHRYYSAHSMPLGTDENGKDRHWQYIDYIDIEDERWLEVCKAAIYGMFHSRAVDLDVA